MQIQTTALTTLVGIFIMFGAAVIIGQRIKQAAVPALRPIQLFRQFFAFFGLFFLFMWAPNILLTTNPSTFPQAMAWGYVVGHIFLYLAFITTALMLCTIVPRLAGKEKIAIWIGAVYTTVLTVANAITMIWGTLPAYNYERSLVEYHAAPIVGAGIGVSALLTILPAGVLFLMNAFRNPAQRARSGLMGVGFLLMTFAGPLHDVATNWQMYAAADILTIIGMILTGIGVLYRLDQSISISRPVPVATVGVPPVPPITPQM